MKVRILDRMALVAVGLRMTNPKPPKKRDSQLETPPDKYLTPRPSPSFVQVIVRGSFVTLIPPLASFVCLIVTNIRADDHEFGRA